MANEVSDFGNENNENNEFAWELLRKYWKFMAFFIIGGFIAFFGAILVFLWYVGTSAIGDQGTWTIDQFSIGSIVIWVIFFIIFELVIIGIPTAVILGGLALWWWLKLPQEEKDQFGSGKPTRRGVGSGGLPILNLIIFLIIIFLQGEWNTALGALSYSYLLFTWLLAFIISGIPFVIAALVWFFYKIMK
ncbi:MAG: hypothetical protein ACFFC7_22950 [Candidatus Hermodarchaeota archaeon]